MTTRDALEAALVANPDDVVLHSAYADLLIEQGDPRGEFVRLQLAAEDEALSDDARREVNDQLFDLRLRHEREWLGGLWEHLQPPPHARSYLGLQERNVSYTWRRGWIDAVSIAVLSAPLVADLAAHPFTRLLGALSVTRNWVHDYGRDSRDQISLQPLLDSGRLATLRQFELGQSERGIVAEGWRVDQAVRAMKRLQSIKLCVDLFSESHLFGGDYPDLHTIDITYNNPRCRFYMLGYNDGLPNLRTLRLDSVSVMPDRGDLGSEREPITDGDLQSFFRSKHLRALEYFTFRNGEFADAGVEELVASGFIGRLKGLDLSFCNITDDGALVLAAHPHVPRLEYLLLGNNLLSPVGIHALAEVGVMVSRDQLFGVPGPYDYAAEFDAQVRAELGMDEQDDGTEVDLDGRSPDSVADDDVPF